MRAIAEGIRELMSAVSAVLVHLGAAIFYIVAACLAVVVMAIGAVGLGAFLVYIKIDEMVH